MKHKEHLKHRFSTDDSSEKWDKMYSENTEYLDEEIFRQRRNFTISYVQANFSKDAVLCDIGCGAGPITAELLKQGYNIVGLDYSVDMLANAKKRIRNNDLNENILINGDCESLPFSDNTFDGVICLGVISYVELYENIIKEIQRILKPEATSIITYRSEYNLIMNNPVTLCIVMAKKLLRIKIHKEYVIGRYMNPKAVEKTIRSSNLDVIDFKGIGFGPYYLNNKKLFNEKTSIKINSVITKTATFLQLNFLFKIACDVHIFTVRKIIPLKNEVP